jgi:TM2 domain-containing membrane protein YozV
MNKVGTAYVLWLGGLVGLSGLHRLYTGQIITGLLWLGTFGLFGFGQLFDLILIPEMVKTNNLRLRQQYGSLLEQNPIAVTIEQARRAEFAGVRSPKLFKQNSTSQQQATIKLLKAAEARGGKISVTQGVLETGLTFQQIETLLKEMLRSGYVEIANDPETGVVLYEFHEL